MSLTFAASGVQRHILTITEHLHSTEIERKNLRETELQLRQQIIKQRHQLETGHASPSQLQESHRELQKDYNTLKKDYTELTKVIQQCESELQQGMSCVPKGEGSCSVLFFLK